MVFLRLGLGGLLLAILPFVVHCQMGAPSHLSSMSYSIVNGKVYVDPPTTPAPTFMETWFPWLSSSYTSSNPEEVDDAILNSVTGPPEPQQSINLHQQNQNPSYSNSYQQQQHQPSSSYGGYNSYNQNQSPYLSNDEDNYIPSSSINTPQYMGPDGNYPQQQHHHQQQGGGGGGYPHPNYLNYESKPPSHHQVHYMNAQPSSYPSGMPPLPYPFSSLPGQPTTESSAPFYQPILDFFGYGESSLDEQLSLPFPGGQLPSGEEFPSSLPSFPQSSFQFIPPQFAQARKSIDEENTRYVDSNYHYDHEVKEGHNEPEGKYSVHGGGGGSGPKKSSTNYHHDNLSVVDSERKDEVVIDDKKKEENPCPKLGYWHWNGEVCIALGPVPVWACKPNDLVMSGRVGVCRNKIFFSPGTNPLMDGTKK